jgi:hypothetical protein
MRGARELFGKGPETTGQVRHARSARPRIGGGFAGSVTPLGRAFSPRLTGSHLIGDIHKVVLQGDGDCLNAVLGV